MTKPTVQILTDCQLPLEELAEKFEIYGKDGLLHKRADVFIIALHDISEVIERCRRVAQEFPHSKRVVVLGSYDYSKYRRQLQRAGCSGICSLESDPAVLVYAVQTVLSGSDYVDPSLPAVANQRSPNPAPELLTDREAEVLRLINWADGDISQALEMKPRTVEKHVECICLKLKVAMRAEAAKKAIALGYVVEPASRKGEGET